MNDDARFGLPLSLAEALRVDPSEQAAQLADLVQDDEERPNRAQRRGRVWRCVMAGLAVAGAVGSVGHAAVPSLEGRWTMAADRSSFQEAVTGPAPDHATMTVSEDDPERLTYELVERRDGLEVAHGVYSVSFVGATSTTQVDGENLQVTASRNADGDVLIQAPPVGRLRAVIRVRRTGPDSAVLEHDVEDADGAIKVERISLVRGGPS